MFAFSQAFRRLIYDDSMIAQFTHDINTVASLQLRYVNVFIDFLFLTACDLFFSVWKPMIRTKQWALTWMQWNTVFSRQKYYEFTEWSWWRTGRARGWTKANEASWVVHMSDKGQSLLYVNWIWIFFYLIYLFWFLVKVLPLMNI